MFHILLYEPEIPPNTGNIIRLCANTGCQLHLIEPLGFELTASAVRRAGLDYHAMATVRTYRNLDACLVELAPRRLFAIESGGVQRYSDVNFAAGDALLFGPETRGLPTTVLAKLGADARLSIPMQADNRSLNLSNAVALVVYEAWRQLGFAGADNP